MNTAISSQIQQKHILTRLVQSCLLRAALGMTLHLLYLTSITFNSLVQSCLLRATLGMTH